MSVKIRVDWCLFVVKNQLLSLATQRYGAGYLYQPLNLPLVSSMIDPNPTRERGNFQRLVPR